MNDNVDEHENNEKATIFKNNTVTIRRLTGHSNERVLEHDDYDMRIKPLHNVEARMKPERIIQDVLKKVHLVGSPKLKVKRLCEST